MFKKITQICLHETKCEIPTRGLNLVYFRRNENEWNDKKREESTYTYLWIFLMYFKACVFF